MASGQRRRSRSCRSEVGARCTVACSLFALLLVSPRLAAAARTLNAPAVPAPAPAADGAPAPGEAAAPAPVEDGGVLAAATPAPSPVPADGEATAARARRPAVPAAAPAAAAAAPAAAPGDAVVKAVLRLLGTTKEQVQAQQAGVEAALEEITGAAWTYRAAEVSGCAPRAARPLPVCDGWHGMETAGWARFACSRPARRQRTAGPASAPSQPGPALARSTSRRGRREKSCCSAACCPGSPMPARGGGGAACARPPAAATLKAFGSWIHLPTRLPACRGCLSTVSCGASKRGGAGG